MTPPLTVFRELRTTGVKLRPRPITVLEVIAGALLLAGAIALLAAYGAPLALWLRRVQYRGGRFGLMLVMAPVLLVCTAVALAYRSWRNRGTEPFPFPVTLRLPRWRIYRRDGDVALHLTDGRGMLCLFVREAPSESLETILDAIDPGEILEFDETQDTREVMHVELSGDNGERPAFGLLRRTADARAYLFVLGNQRALLDDVGGPLRMARLREPGAAPQKWRPADVPQIAAARVRR